MWWESGAEMELSFDFGLRCCNRFSLDLMWCGVGTLRALTSLLSRTLSERGPVSVSIGGGLGVGLSGRRHLSLISLIAFPSLILPIVRGRFHLILCLSVQSSSWSCLGSVYCLTCIHCILLSCF